MHPSSSPSSPLEGKIRFHPGSAALLLCALLPALPVHAQTTGDNGSHDPSRMIESEGKVYLYSTGGGGKSSTDGIAWKTVSPRPAWNMDLLPDDEGLWAPDIIRHNGLYYLYGSMWAQGNKSSAITLITSPTLDPESPDYKWTDRGVAVAGPSGVTHSCIDPAPLVDQDGKMWLVWGGGYPFPDEAGSIWLTRLDNATGLPLAADPGYDPPHKPGHALKKGHKEAPYIHFHGGYYYLWWQRGSCCSGAASTYTMHVARSRSVTGPYEGDRVFYASDRGAGINGPGHMGIYSCGGTELFTYHYYPATGFSVVGMNVLEWGGDGWPKVGPRATAGLLKLPCATSTGISGAAGEAVPGRLRVRRARDGFDLYIPGTGKDGSPIVFDGQGREVSGLRLESGWNRLPAGMLSPGLNIVRVRLGRRTASAPVFNR